MLQIISENSQWASTGAVCIVWLVFTADSRTEGLHVLLTKSNSCHCNAHTGCMYPIQPLLMSVLKYLCRCSLVKNEHMQNPVNFKYQIPGKHVPTPHPLTGRAVWWLLNASLVARVSVSWFWTHQWNSATSYKCCLLVSEKALPHKM